MLCIERSGSICVKKAKLNYVLNKVLLLHDNLVDYLMVIDAFRSFHYYYYCYYHLVCVCVCARCLCFGKYSGVGIVGAGECRLSTSFSVALRGLITVCGSFGSLCSPCGFASRWVAPNLRRGTGGILHLMRKDRSWPSLCH